MKNTDIIAVLKQYQSSEGKPEVLEELAQKLIVAINPRITRAFGAPAEVALRRVLTEMFATPVRAQLCLDAMLQLCRDESWEFEIGEDCGLIQRIKNETYFVSQIPCVPEITIHQSER